MKKLIVYVCVFVCAGVGAGVVVSGVGVPCLRLRGVGGGRAAWTTCQVNMTYTVLLLFSVLSTSPFHPFAYNFLQYEWIMINNRLNISIEDRMRKQIDYCY